MVSKAGKRLMGLFYFLQGLVNVVFGVFYLRVDVSLGGSGGFAAGMEGLLRSSLVFASLFSFGVVFALYFEFERLAMFCGVVGALVFCLFYGFLAELLVWVVRTEFSLLAASVLLLSVVSMVLNLVAVVFLGRVVYGVR